MNSTLDYLLYCCIKSLVKSLEEQQGRDPAQEEEKLDAFIAWAQENDVDPRSLCEDSNSLDGWIEFYNKFLEADPEHFEKTFKITPHNNLNEAPEIGNNKSMPHQNKHIPSPEEKEQTMGFIDAKCPACAKAIEIPAETTEFFCPYCGSKFLRDAAYAYARMPEISTGEADLSDFVIVGTTLTAYTGTKPNVIIPDYVTTIGKDAFKENKYVSTLVIPDSVTSIGCGAFRSCTSLKRASMSNNIVAIDSFAFAGCNSLCEINFPHSLIKIDGYAFNGCLSLATAFIPSSCELGMGVFSDSPTKVTRI